MTTLRNITPSEFNDNIQQQNTFVLNILADWCSDCTAQQMNIIKFSELMAESELVVLQLVAQKEKGIFISLEHQILIEKLGGHGYPRTILVIEGDIVSSDNVEVITDKDLTILASTFKKLL